MRKLSMTIVFCCIVITLQLATTQVVNLDPKDVEQWFLALPRAKTRLTKLHFYFHDKVSGTKASAVRVARSNTTSASPTLFGAVFVMDDPLTTGPEPSSNVIGRAHGIYASTSKQEVGLLMTLNFVFTSGNFKGSSLGVLGYNSVFHKHRELPITGGSGIFRLAHGIATAKTYFVNSNTNDAIVEYHLMVMHYI